MRIHFIAIGGAVMHNMAIDLHKMENVVTGSDDEIFDPAKSNLKKYNLLPEKFGWYPEKIKQELDLVILGMHAKKDNPELLAAIRMGIKIYSFPEYVYENSKKKKRVVIAGSHGKTSITSMVMHVLKDNNFEFDYLVGSSIKGFDTMVKITDSAPLIVIEGDEYLSSPIDSRPKFHWYKPDIAVINGIAWDHINVFPTFEIYKKQFQVFAESVAKNNGQLFYYDNDQHINEILKKGKISGSPYHEHDAEIIDNKIKLIDKKDNRVPVQIIGSHNLINLNAAYHVCKEIGVTDKQFYSSIQSFSGAGRRLEILAENKDSIAFIDFAHAPSKLKATVDAVKKQYADKTLIAFFELHTFSSLNKEYLTEYKNSLKQADKAYLIYDSHAVQLKKLEQMDKEDIVKSFNRASLQVIESKDEFLNSVQSENSKNSVYLFMSSGNFFGAELKTLMDNKFN